MPQRHHDTPQGTVCLARVGRPFGVRGAFWIVSYTHPDDNIFSYETLHLWSHHEAVPISLHRHACASRKTSRKTSSSLVAWCKDVTSREEAEAWRNAAIIIKKSDLPPCQEDEFYFHDLTGLRVHDRQGHHCGVVSHCYDTGAGAAIVSIRSLSGTRVWDVPFTKTAVVMVNVQQGFLVVGDAWREPLHEPLTGKES